MVSIYNAGPKPKLPRKRKKAAIKAQGRKWYRDTILLHYICQLNPVTAERVCRFWDNSSLQKKAGVSALGLPFVVKVPKRYW